MLSIKSLHDSVPPTLHLLRRWHEQKQYSYLTVGLQALRVFSKNENNMGTMLKLEVVQFLTVLLKVHPKVEVVELLGILVKTNSATHCSIPVTYLLALLSSGPDPVQRAVCKVLKVLLETDEGRQKFVDAGGVKTVMETLDSLSAAGNNGGASEMTASVPPSTGPNTLFNFLLTLLRSAISRTDLPFISQYTTLKFPLPSPVASFSTLDLIPPSPLTAPSSTTRAALGSPDDVTHLFPENDLLSGLPTPTQALPATIQVRHVQPIVRHFGLANRWSEAPEPLGKKVGPRKVVVVDELKKVGEAGEVVYEVGRGPCGSDRTALIFDSRFESGNLQMAIKIGDFEYDLVLQSDINSPAGKHNQWFYFSVQNMISGQPYTFNIVNMSKPNSQFNQGMQPVMFSMAEGLWRRVGRDVCYYKNHYRKPTTDSATNAPGGSSTPASKEKDGGSAAQNYATLTVNYTFPAEDDTCLIAYHYPYTYSDLQRMLFQHQLDKSFGERCRRQTLCKTLGGNEVALLTITDFTPASTSVCPVRDRMYVFLSARVHPGESNSSHIMHGLLSYLLSSTSDTAVFLRQHCIFKIVPMLNPDGVVNGSHRCSLAGVDLNRQWRTPDKVLCPEIWWTKRIWKAVCETPWTDVSSILESMALPPPAPPSTPTGSRRVAMNGSCDKGVAPQAMPSRASTPPQSSGRKVLLACDFHGHSRKKSTFLFTCLGMPSANASNDLQSAQQANQQQPQQSQSLGINMTSGSQTSWFSPNPSLTTTNASFSSASGSSQSVSSSPLSSAPHPNLFPSLLASFSPIFDPSQTTHTITPAKESTARAVLHRELGIYHAYTFESSYCGSDVGAYPSHSNGESLGRDNVAGKGFQFRGKELREAGVDFVRSLKVLAEGEVAAAGLASGAQTATSSAGIGACGNSSIANSTVGGLASRA
ncbi:hypothetical protein DFS34DRAFT_298389 [Phlyctochytrium arcticum]|nr:hypothetical protein DFS34DRAFT_298389 [Phlyctochytrium arcticum]